MHLLLRTTELIGTCPWLLPRSRPLELYWGDNPGLLWWIYGRRVRGAQARAARFGDAAGHGAARGAASAALAWARDHREVVSAAADLDVLQAFAVRTGPKGDRASGSPGSFSR